MTGPVSDLTDRPVSERRSGDAGPLAWPGEAEAHRAAGAYGQHVLAYAEVTGDAPALAGFIASSFSPLVAEAAARCLTRAGRIPRGPEAGQDPPAGTPVTGIVVASRTGDLATAVSVAQAVDSGSRLGPLLFFQAVPNAVAGYVAARWGLTGPVVCLSPSGEPLDDAFATADLLLGDGDADEVLIVLAEQSPLDGGGDHACAVLSMPTLGVQS